MGVGYGPNASYVMRWDDVRTLVPDAAHALETALGNKTVEEFCQATSTDSLDDLGFELDDDEFDTHMAQIDHAWNDLATAFENATTVDGAGLSIEPGYHNPDDGDRYDDDAVNGGFFYVDGVTKVTPAGKQFKEHIQWTMWLEFG